MSKFSNFKIKWAKSVEKLENGGRLGTLRQDLPPPPKAVRWIRPCNRITYQIKKAYSLYLGQYSKLKCTLLGLSFIN